MRISPPMNSPHRESIRLERRDISEGDGTTKGQHLRESEQPVR